MDRSIIKQVQDAGFDVYMRNERDTYMIFTDGESLGYLEYNGSFTLSTVHKPNRQTGTGFQIERHVYTIDAATLKACFIHAPHWATGADRNSVHKYKGIEDYRTSDTFKREYQLIPTEKEEAPK